MQRVKNFAIANNKDLEEQLYRVSNSKAYKDEIIRLVPDAHEGASGPVGFVSTVNNNKIIPMTIGSDIACRVSLFKLPINIADIDEEFLKKFDKMVAERIPTGFNVRNKEAEYSKDFPYEDLMCYPHLKNIGRIRKSMGTLGGGNHYLELDQDETGDLYLSIHCGSRNLGKQVAEYYQNLAVEMRDNRIALYKECCEEEISYMKKGGEFQKIQGIKEKYAKRIAAEPEKEMCYLANRNLDNYLHDMYLCNKWSQLNHTVIFQEICDGIQEIKE